MALIVGSKGPLRNSQRPLSLWRRELVFMPLCGHCLKFVRVPQCGGKLSFVSRRLLRTEFVEQRLCLFEIGHVEALSEPTIDRREEVASFRAAALIAP